MVVLVVYLETWRGFCPIGMPQQTVVDVSQVKTLARQWSFLGRGEGPAQICQWTARPGGSSKKGLERISLADKINYTGQTDWSRH